MCLVTGKVRGESKIFFNEPGSLRNHGETIVCNWHKGTCFQPYQIKSVLLMLIAVFAECDFL